MPFRSMSNKGHDSPASKTTIVFACFSYDDANETDTLPQKLLSICDNLLAVARFKLMADIPSVIYGLETRARALCPQGSSDAETIRFLVGTQSFRGNDHRGEDNQVHIVEYDEELNTTRKNIFSHTAGEIWQIASSNSNPLLFSTSYNRITNDSKSEIRASLWKLPIEDDGDDLDDDGTVRGLSKVTDLGTEEQGDMKYVIFSPSEDSGEVVTLSDSSFFFWDVEHGTSDGAALKGKFSFESKGNPKFTSGRWDPHHGSKRLATTNDCCVRGWDLRSMEQVYVIETAHGQLVRDVDFNPNRQYIMATCGDDCHTKFWDVRNPQKPLKSLDDHSHWVWSVRFNHFHDQLVLTSSSDSRVILNNISSLSSDPYGKYIEDLEADDDDEGNADLSCSTTSKQLTRLSPSTSQSSRTADQQQMLKDSIVHTYEEHEDSVYAVEWSTADPWVFASLSYDGRLVINHVPRSEKYKILL